MEIPIMSCVIADTSSNGEDNAEKSFITKWKCILFANEEYATEQGVNQCIRTFSLGQTLEQCTDLSDSIALRHGAINSYLVYGWHFQGL